MAATKIQWTNKVWNPITGCSPCSEGCINCYAKKMANRLRGRFGYPLEDPFKVTFHPDRLKEPSTWKKPCKVFAISMGDLFHPDVKDLWQVMVLNQIHWNPQHTFQILTKRPEIAIEQMRYFNFKRWNTFQQPNLWLGVTVENQKCAERRIPILKEIPAITRFLSVEPMLEEIDLSGHLKGIDWVICGAETGQRARLFNPNWAVSLKEQCQNAGIPFFFKSFGPNCIPTYFQYHYLNYEKDFPE